MSEAKTSATLSPEALVAVDEIVRLGASLLLPTPRPWRVGAYAAVRGMMATIEAGEGNTFIHIATIFSRADAELIVKAVNDAG